MNELLERYPMLIGCKSDIEKTVNTVADAFRRGGKLLLAGNGGSAADCDHIVGELMKGFVRKRMLTDEKKAEMKLNFPDISDSVLNRLQGGLPAISLPSVTALNTAYANDCDPELVYAQSVMALGKKGDILLAISTSGNARNVCAAATVAKALGLTVIALSGASGGRLSGIADITVRVPEDETYKIQELHLPVYHYICKEIESMFFDE